MPANTYTLIEKITVGAAGASSITFTSIPQTYTDLKIVVSARTNWSNSVNADGINIRPNGSTSSRTAIRLYGSGSAAGSDTNINPIAASNASSTASTFGNAEIYIPNYAGSTNKSMSVDGVSETNGTTTYAGLAAFLWSNTAAITSLDIYPENGTSFSQYSTFYLYGIAKEGVTPADSSAPYATGGDSIVFDGTYWIHTFTSSGTFTPKKGLTCDYLVVAGGGGGGNNYAGGGGAGGLRSTVTATGGGGSLESALSLAANTGYTVTVGGGGAGSTANNTRGTVGSNSVFSTITSTGGGGGGSRDGSGTQSAGGSGGSGGGAGSDSNNTGGSASPSGQGYGGGNSTNSGEYPGGGGGGAGAVGANATSTVAGNGGSGAAVSITGSSVTYAGGGGGGCNVGGTNGTGGSGGGGNGSKTAGGAGGTGTVNLGAGGGAGGPGNGNGGAGGSGIVIVRYAA